MRIAVVGAGAIGGYVGAMLARGGADVHLIARGSQLQAIQRDGLQVLSPHGDFVVQTPATSDPAEIGPVDIVFLGLKAHHHPSAAPLVRPLLGTGTTIVAAQNGIPWWYFHRLAGPYEGRRVESVDPGGVVSAALPAERTVGCVVYCSSELAGPGVVRHRRGRRFVIGEPDGSLSERCLYVRDAMSGGGLEWVIDDRIRDSLWAKLMGNVAFNPLSVLTRSTIAEMCRHWLARRLVASMMEEALEVARKLGSTPAISVEQRLRAAEGFGGHKPSTLQDFEAGRPLELDAIVGAVVELADLTRTPAPSLRNIHAAVDLLVHSSTPHQRTSTPPCRPARLETSASAVASTDPETAATPGHRHASQARPGSTPPSAQIT